MSGRTYIDDIIEALFEGKNHRKFVLLEVQRRIVNEMERIINLISLNKEQNKLSKDDDWWKNNLIMVEKNKSDVIWFGGLNNKTISNMMGSATIEICRKLCSENYDALKSLVKELPEDFPRPLIKFQAKKERIELNEIESFLFLFTIMSMSKSLTGGIWSEIGKQAADSFMKIVFQKLKIPNNKNVGISYVLNETGDKGEMDAIIYFKEQKLFEIEVKLLGGGNPEVAREAIAFESDIFIVDEISEKMQKIAESKGIKIIHFKDVLTELPKLIDKKIKVK